MHKRNSQIQTKQKRLPAGIKPPRSCRAKASVRDVVCMFVYVRTGVFELGPGKGETCDPETRDMRTDLSDLCDSQARSALGTPAQIRQKQRHSQLYAGEKDLPG